METIAFISLQTIATRPLLSSALGLGRLLVAAAPSPLFAGTWLLTGLWSLGLWVAVLAYLPAVLVTWKPGWGWRIFDVVLLLPVVLLTWAIGLGAWVLAPLHAFPPGKLSIFSAPYLAVMLIGIWGIFGRRRIPMMSNISSSTIDGQRFVLLIASRISLSAETQTAYNERSLDT